LERDPLFRLLRGMFVAQDQAAAKVLAAEHAVECLVVDYDLLRGIDSVEDRLF
jgi:hypothetical protein